MSARHVRWVLANRDKYTDQLDREIMVTIASHIGADDSPATMSIGTIAEYVGCHYNTADKRTKALADRGLLVIEPQGRYLTYGLPAPADGHGHEGDEPAPHGSGGNSKEIDNLKDTVNALREDVKELRSIVTSLSHDLHTIVTSPSHHLHTSVTSGQREDVNKERKNVSREEDYIHTRAGIAEEVDNGLNGSGKRHQMITAISNVVKETLTPENQDRFESVADGFIAVGITVGQVDSFGHWWQENGNYPGRPALTTLQNEIKNSIDGVKVHSSKNGTASRDAMFDKAKRYARKALDIKDCTTEERVFLNNMGGGNAENIQRYDDTKFRVEFFKTWKEEAVPA